MMQILYPWTNRRIRQSIYGFWLLGILLTLYNQWLPELWSNLGYIKRNQALIQAKAPENKLFSEDLSQAVRLLAHSGKFDQCNPLGFFPQSIAVCSEVAQWTKETIPVEIGTKQQTFFAPRSLKDIKYGQVLSLTLFNREFRNLDSLILMTLTGNSTRIKQGALVAYAVVITTEENAYLMPLRAGLETAEGTYDFPDVPPQHIKPIESYTRPGGGYAYPVSFKFEPPVSPKIIIILFAYSQRWHVEPSLLIWAVTARNMTDSASGLEGRQ